MRGTSGVPCQSGVVWQHQTDTADSSSRLGPPSLPQLVRAHALRLPGLYHTDALKQRRLAVRRYPRPCTRVVLVRVGVARDLGGVDLVGLAILGAGQVRFLLATE